MEFDDVSNEVEIPEEATLDRTTLLEGALNDLMNNNQRLVGENRELRDSYALRLNALRDYNKHLNRKNTELLYQNGHLEIQLGQTTRSEAVEKEFRAAIPAHFETRTFLSSPQWQELTNSISEKLGDFFSDEIRPLLQEPHEVEANKYEKFYETKAEVDRAFLEQRVKWHEKMLGEQVEMNRKQSQEIHDQREEISTLCREFEVKKSDLLAENAILKSGIEILRKRSESDYSCHTSIPPAVRTWWMEQVESDKQELQDYRTWYSAKYNECEALHKELRELKSARQGLIVPESESKKPRQKDEGSRKRIADSAASNAHTRSKNVLNQATLQKKPAAQDTKPKKQKDKHEDLKYPIKYENDDLTYLGTSRRPAKRKCNTTSTTASNLLGQDEKRKRPTLSTAITTPPIRPTPPTPPTPASLPDLPLPPVPKWKRRLVPTKPLPPSPLRQCETLSANETETSSNSNEAQYSRETPPQTGQCSGRVYSLRDSTRGRVQYPAWWSESCEGLVRSGEKLWAANGAYEDFIL